MASDIFSGVAWYYGDNDEPSSSLKSHTQHAQLAVPDTNSCMTCNTSGGFRNLERGVQPLACEAHPKIFGCHTHFQFM